MNQQVVTQTVADAYSLLLFHLLIFNSLASSFARPKFVCHAKGANKIDSLYEARRVNSQSFANNYCIANHKTTLAAQKQLALIYFRLFNSIFSGLSRGSSLIRILEEKEEEEEDCIWRELLS